MAVAERVEVAIAVAEMGATVTVATAAVVQCLARVCWRVSVGLTAS